MSIRLHRICCLLAILSFQGLANSDEPKRIAILVGVNQYQHDGFEPLKCAENDVSELARELRRHRFEAEILTGSAVGPNQATLKNVGDRFQNRLKDVKKGDIVVIGLFGHGRMFPAIEQGKPQLDECFCPVDAKETDRKTMIQLNSLVKELSQHGSHNIIFVDGACKIPKKADGETVGLAARWSAVPDNTAIFYSCRLGQISYEDPDSLRHGTFAHSLLKALHDFRAGEQSLMWFDLVSRVLDEFNSLEVELAIPQDSVQEPALVGGIQDFVFSAGKERKDVAEGQPSFKHALAGIWKGQWDGEPTDGNKPTSLTMLFLQQANSITGFAYEETSVKNKANSKLFASIEGRIRQDGEIEFKTKPEGSAGVHPGSTFRGLITAEANPQINGTWESDGGDKGHLSLKPMPAEELKPGSGVWYGSFFYPEGGPQQPVDFQLFAIQIDDRIVGFTKEPNTFGSNDTAWLFASVEGNVTQNSKAVRFTKKYDGTGGQSHPVEYSCQISKDGLKMAHGKWVLGGNFSGKFILHKCVP